MDPARQSIACIVGLEGQADEVSVLLAQHFLVKFGWTALCDCLRHLSKHLRKLWLHRATDRVLAFDSRVFSRVNKYVTT